MLLYAPRVCDNSTHIYTKFYSPPALSKVLSHTNNELVLWNIIECDDFKHVIAHVLVGQKVKS